MDLFVATLVLVVWIICGIVGLLLCGKYCSLDDESMIRLAWFMFLGIPITVIGMVLVLDSRKSGKATMLIKRMCHKLSGKK